MKVEDVMNKIVVIDNDISVKEAAKIMSDKNLGCLVVMDDSVEGIITERDIMKNLDKVDSDVSKIMSKNVITISPDASLDQAAEIMTKNNIKKLPVMKGGKLLGIITATDIVANSDSLNENFLLD
jgi:CBS domain-containing protein